MTTDQNDFEDEDEAVNAMQKAVKALARDYGYTEADFEKALAWMLPGESS